MIEKAVLVSVDAAGRALARWDLASGVLTLGRSPDNDIVLDDREVSRRHGELRHDGSGYVLADLGSKNGLTLNGRPLTSPMRLTDGDEIRVAPQFRFLFFDDAATLPAARNAPALQVDSATRLVSLGPQRLDPPLAVAQFAALELLCSAPGRVFSRDELAAACYPDAKGGVSDQAVDGVMRRLRQRLAELDEDHEFIVAYRGYGYLLQADA